MAFTYRSTKGSLLTAAEVDANFLEVETKHTQVAADAAQVAGDALQTAGDRVQTGVDAAATAADRVQTGLDAVSTAADAVQTAADRVQTGLDAASTAADVVLTAADVTKANEWAEKAEDVEVETGQYSALHHAAKAAALSHTQNTDTGTTSETFQIDSGDSGPKLKQDSGTLVARNAADDADAPVKGASFKTGAYTLTVDETKDLSDKADKVTSPTAGNLAELDADGNLVDSGVDADTPEFDSVTLTNGQLVFPATQNASSDPNTLDDYEEGTWTPNLRFGGGTVDIAYSTRSGVYTKIGNMVFISARVILTSKGSSSGVASIAGLPFSVYVTDSHTFAASISDIRNISFADMVTVRIFGTVVEFLETTNAGTISDLTNADFADNSSFCLDAAYRIA